MSLFDRFHDLVHDRPHWARPQVVLSALLIVALLAQVGTVAWPVLRHKLDAKMGQGAGAPVASGPTLTIRPGLSIATIIAGHLFGAAEPEAGPTEKTALPLELMGTFAADDPASGIAFLREGPGGPQQVYRVGETLPGGGVLREVYRTRILFARAGRMEELQFPEHPLQFAGPPSVGAIAALVAAGSSYSTAGLPAGPMSQAEAEVIAGAALEAQLAAEADAAAEKAARQPGAKPWKLAEREPDSPPEH